MSSLSEIRAMGSILERKSRGRLWNNDIPKSEPKKKKKKQKSHIDSHWEEVLKDTWS